MLQLLQLVYGSSSIKAGVNSDRRKKISQAVGKRDAVVEPRTTNKTNPVCGHSRTTRCFPLVTVNARHRVMCNSEDRASDREGPVKSLTLSSTLSLLWSHFSGSPYCLPYNSYYVSSESLVLDQLTKGREQVKVLIVCSNHIIAAWSVSILSCMTVSYWLMFCCVLARIWWTGFMVKQHV